VHVQMLDCGVVYTRLSTCTMATSSPGPPPPEGRKRRPWHRPVEYDLSLADVIVSFDWLNLFQHISIN